MCTTCGKKTGFYRGKVILKSNEYCDSCYAELCNDEENKYEASLDLPKNTYSIGYIGGFNNIDSFIEDNYLDKLIFNKKQLDKGNTFFWIKENHLNFALSTNIKPKKGQPFYMEIFRDIGDLQKNQKISPSEAEQRMVDLRLEKTFISIVMRSNNPILSASINIDDVLYYNRVGDVHEITSGGGISLAGTLIGGVVGGGAGAIIGGRKKIDTEIMDERNTVLIFKNNDDIKSILFSSSTFDVFSKLIPNKAYDNLQNNHIANQVNNYNNDKYNIINQIKKLSELKEEGILTEEEFQEKKRELLSKI